MASHSWTVDLLEKEKLDSVVSVQWEARSGNFSGAKASGTTRTADWQVTMSDDTVATADVDATLQAGTAAGIPIIARIFAIPMDT